MKRYECITRYIDVFNKPDYEWDEMVHLGSGPFSKPHQAYEDAIYDLREIMRTYSKILDSVNLLETYGIRGNQNVRSLDLTSCDCDLLVCLLDLVLYQDAKNDGLLKRYIKNGFFLRLLEEIEKKDEEVSTDNQDLKIIRFREDAYKNGRHVKKAEYIMTDLKSGATEYIYRDGKRKYRRDENYDIKPYVFTLTSEELDTVKMDLELLDIFSWKEKYEGQYYVVPDDEWELDIVFESGALIPVFGRDNIPDKLKELKDIFRYIYGCDKRIQK